MSNLNIAAATTPAHIQQRKAQLQALRYVMEDETFQEWTRLVKRPLEDLAASLAREIGERTGSKVYALEVAAIAPDVTPPELDAETRAHNEFMTRVTKLLDRSDAKKRASQPMTVFNTRTACKNRRNLARVVTAFA